MTKEQRMKYAKGICSEEYIATGTPRFGEKGLTLQEMEEADALCREIEAKTAEMVERDIKPKDTAEKIFDEIIEKLNKKVISKAEARTTAETALLDYLGITSFGGTTVEKYFQITELCRGKKRKETK